uniref:Unclassified n=1 Tax=Fusarium clavum TaxID=2594811 RepID=W1IBG3_9HYPO|nr:unclassified [Fusarium clavum]CEF82663.1 unclassified [Fusarium clavum]
MKVVSWKFKTKQGRIWWVATQFGYKDNWRWRDTGQLSKSRSESDGRSTPFTLWWVVWWVPGP